MFNCLRFNVIVGCIRFGAKRVLLPNVLSLTGHCLNEKGLLILLKRLNHVAKVIKIWEVRLSMLKDGNFWSKVLGGKRKKTLKFDFEQSGLENSSTWGG